MEHIQTGNMLDVVVDNKDIGLKPRHSMGAEIIWLPNPQGLVDVLQNEIDRLYAKQYVKSIQSTGRGN
jgi:hypothetical protein